MGGDGGGELQRVEPGPGNGQAAVPAARLHCGKLARSVPWHIQRAVQAPEVGLLEVGGFCIWGGTGVSPTASPTSSCSAAWPRCAPIQRVCADRASASAAPAAAVQPRH